MKEKGFLYDILFNGLLQIREEAYLSKNKKIFWISNLLHNLPLHLKPKGLFDGQAGRAKVDAAPTKMGFDYFTIKY